MSHLLYFSYDFPDPQLFYEECHLSQPGWICDPSDVLTSTQRKYKCELIFAMYQWRLIKSLVLIVHAKSVSILAIFD